MLQIENHSHHIYLSIPETSDRLEILETYRNHGHHYAWEELITHLFESINPDVWQIGLTCNPYIFVNSLTISDDGETADLDGSIYYYAHYQTSDPVEKLIVGETVRFEKLTDCDDENNKLWRHK